MLRDLVELMGPHSEENGIADLKKLREEALVRFFIWLALWLILIVFVGSWLWNNSLKPAVPALEKVGFWQFAGIAILLAILLGR